jgi:hypothetical protein
MQSQRRKKKEKSDSDDEDDSKSPTRHHGRPASSFTRAAVNDIRERPISYLASIAIYSYVALLFLERISSDQGTLSRFCVMLERRELIV